MEGDEGAERVPMFGGSDYGGLKDVVSIGRRYNARLGGHHQLYFHVNRVSGCHIDLLEFQLFVASLMV